MAFEDFDTLRYAVEDHEHDGVLPALIIAEAFAYFPQLANDMWSLDLLVEDAPAFKFYLGW